jgi:hypothetical protein
MCFHRSMIIANELDANVTIGPQPLEPPLAEEEGEEEEEEEEGT